MYNQAGVDALDEVRAVVASFGAPIAFRKLYGLLNAMEMHVEETPYSVEALQHLGKALEVTVRLYQVDEQQSTTLARALATFLRKVEKKEQVACRNEDTGEPNEQSIPWNMANH